MSEAVRVDNLVKRFGEVRAVDDVGFVVGEGEFFTLLGPSGCGKTTTLRCVAGLESADQGRITIGGDSVFDAGAGIDRPANDRAIGMVFQSYAVWPHMSVAENIGYPLKIRGAARSVIAERVSRALDMLDMAGLGSRMPAQLSGGQQQRVALGRALAVEPRVLLLDEPLSNLDAKLREQMRAELKRVQRRTGLPILYVTHDQIEALAMSDRIAVMEKGRVHQLAGPEEIYNAPATRFVLEFIGSVNYLPCRMSPEAAAADVSLILATGEAIAIPRPAFVPLVPECDLAIRPEDIRLVAPQESPLRGRVVLRAFLGEGLEYHIRVHDREMRVRCPASISAREGDEVGLAIDKGILLERDDRAPESG